MVNIYTVLLEGIENEEKSYGCQDQRPNRTGFFWFEFGSVRYVSSDLSSIYFDADDGGQLGT
jgi:hypothetical protein